MQLTNVEVQRHLDATRSNVLHKVQQLRKRRRTHRLLAAGGALLIAGSGIGAAFAVAQVSARQAQTGVVCYQHDDLNSLTSTIQMGNAVDPVTGKELPAALLDAQEGCALAYRSGLAVAGPHGEHWPDVDPNDVTNPKYTVPPLAFCYLANGTRAGFPIETPSRTAAAVCERLGLRQMKASAATSTPSARSDTTQPTLGASTTGPAHS